MLRRIYQKEQKGKSKKGASGCVLRTLLAELKSGQFICSKSGQFYLLTTGKNWRLAILFHVEQFFGLSLV